MIVPLSSTVFDPWLDYRLQPFWLIMTWTESRPANTWLVAESSTF
jgi:hypothetical protein